MRIPALCLALFVSLAACDQGDSGPVAVPDIELLDVNPNSATHGQYVGPRHHADHVSAWYFGKST